MRLLSASVIGAALALFGVLAFMQWRDADHAAIIAENPVPPPDLAETHAARSAAEKRLADAMTSQINNWPKANETKTPEHEAKPEAQVMARVEPPRPGMSNADQDALLNRVDGLLKQGDIGAARAVLNRLVRENNPRAAYLLARSYDPQVIKQGKVVGMRADPVLARDLYQKALQGGVTEAKAALDALGTE